MARRTRRQPFPTDDYSSERVYEGDRSGGVFSFFRDHGVRETVESIVVAVILALLFRAYEAEAFIIPTGSMAPTLQGQHMDVVCSQCGHQYRTGAQYENSTIASGDRDKVTRTFCPICQFGMPMRPDTDPDHDSNSGDRILVNKFIYDFSEPKRFDVIVFKNPNNGKQNFIKRLVGLPGDNLLIENGDLFDMQPGGDGWTGKDIIRKPADKVQPMLQLVDDTAFIAEKLTEANWPSRWQQWRDQSNESWQENISNGEAQYYVNEVDEEQWLRYRHLIPDPVDWTDIERGELPDDEHWRGRLISDYYCYNDVENRKHGLESSVAAHWVGDLAVECDVEIKSGNGVFALDLVEGGAHFTCRLDVGTGNISIECHSDAVFQTDDGVEVGPATSENPVTGSSEVNGPGTYNIMFANVDDELFLWVNSQLIQLSASKYTRQGVIRPRYSFEDPGDAEPVGIGCQNLAVNVNRLRILRDIYYTAAVDQRTIAQESSEPLQDVYRTFRDPRLWDSPQATRIFTAGKNRRAPMFELQEDQFLPMGDNSPRSSDGRIWPGPKFLPREMLIGRAMIIYWPHFKNKPIPYYTPNFEEMGFIR
ncbi:MAG: signal peptidase I [Planctomycetota bacterium]